MQTKVKLRVRGFTLIEVIITTFILAIGLLAVVAMQAVAKRSSFETQQRTVAMQLAEDMVERIRLNNLAWQANNPATVIVGDGQTARTRPACAQDSGMMSNCSMADLVNYDLYHWEYALNANSAESTGGLVKPNGCVLLSPQGQLTVVVSWVSRQSFTGIASGNTVEENCGAESDKRRSMLLSTWVAS
jgi:type IV pilus assembly protein PilV